MQGLGRLPGLTLQSGLLLSATVTPLRGLDALKLVPLAPFWVLLCKVVLRPYLTRLQLSLHNEADAARACRNALRSE